MFLILLSGLANQKTINVLLIVHVSLEDKENVIKTKPNPEAGSSSKGAKSLLPKYKFLNCVHDLQDCVTKN